ncbi:hypothetical protein ACFC1T_08110 [Kitasatospora sp. NPDC056076]|uniref:hypothetical protein n=1 Tax=Kitasatospora sp. NPDC056076 TaxID=3345703 RepID=UPI0035D6A14E
MPKINLPENTPWWVVGLLAFVLVLAYAVRIVANAILPRQSDHRLSWWREWWEHRKAMTSIKRSPDLHVPPGGSGEKHEEVSSSPPVR